MKSWNGLTLAILALLSDNATLVLAQYVTTVTISINANPFCTPMSGIGAYGGIPAIPGMSSGEAGGPVSELASGSLNGSASSTGSATISGGGFGGPVFESIFASPTASASSTNSSSISRRDHIFLFQILLLGVLTCLPAPPPFLP